MKASQAVFVAHLRPRRNRHCSTATLADTGRESVAPALAFDITPSAVPPWILAEQISARRARADSHSEATSAWPKPVRQGVPIAMQPIRVLYPQPVETPGEVASQQPPLTICADTTNPCATEATNNHPADVIVKNRVLILGFSGIDPSGTRFNTGLDHFCSVFGIPRTKTGSRNGGQIEGSSGVPEASMVYPKSSSSSRQLEILTVAALSANRLITAAFVADQQIAAGSSRRIEPTQKLRNQFVEEEVNAPMFKFTRLLDTSRQTALQRVKPEELSNVYLCLSIISLCKSSI
jgi:hypothetical protein